MRRTDCAVTALREKSAVEGAELVLLAIERLARFEIDVGEPEITASSHRLVLQDRGGARPVHAQAIAVAEQVPAVPQIFVIAVRGRPDGRTPALPLAGRAVDAVGEETDLGAPLEHRDERALGGGAIAVVTRGPAQDSELRNEGAGLGRIGFPAAK